MWIFSNHISYMYKFHKIFSKVLCNAKDSNCEELCIKCELWLRFSPKERLRMSIGWYFFTFFSFYIMFNTCKKMSTFWRQSELTMSNLRLAFTYERWNNYAFSTYGMDILYTWRRITLTIHFVHPMFLISFIL